MLMGFDLKDVEKMILWLISSWNYDCLLLFFNKERYGCKFLEIHISVIFGTMLEFDA